MRIDNIKEIANINEKPKFPIILIGNKLDLKEEEIKVREVTEEEAKKKCEEYDVFWGGEISFKNIEYEKLIELIKGYVNEIYNQIGEKTQKYQPLKKRKQKRKNDCYLI